MALHSVVIWFRDQTEREREKGERARVRAREMHTQGVGFVSGHRANGSISALPELDGLLVSR